MAKQTLGQTLLSGQRVSQESNALLVVGIDVGQLVGLNGLDRRLRRVVLVLRGAAQQTGDLAGIHLLGVAIAAMSSSGCGRWFTGTEEDFEAKAGDVDLV